MGNLRLKYRKCLVIQTEAIVFGPSRFTRSDVEASPGDDDGHSWNNPLAHATFYDNVEKFGKQEALSLLRQDIRSFIREKKGEKTDWSLKFDGAHLFMENEEMQNVLSHPITHENSILVDASIKEMVPYEISTFREAEDQIARGAKQVILPEHHVLANGEVGARFLTILTQDELNPSVFHGSRVDLKVTARITEIREKFIEASMTQGKHDFHESQNEKNAFILSSNSVKEIQSLADKVFPKGNEKIVKEMTHKDIQRSFADAKSGQGNQTVSKTLDTAFLTGGKIFRDGAESAAMLGEFLVHAVEKKIKMKREKEKNNVMKKLGEVKQSAGFFERQWRYKKFKVSKEVLIHIFKKFTEFRETKNILSLVQTEVGIGAGIYALEVLARELPKSLRKIEKKRMKIHRTKERNQLKQRAPHESEKSRLLARPRKERLIKEMKEMKRKKKDVFEALNNKAVRVEKKQTSSKEKKQKSKKEKRIILAKKEKVIIHERSRRPKRERKLKFVIGVLLERLAKERLSFKRTALKKKEKRVFSKKEVKYVRAEGRIFRKAEARKKEMKMQKRQEKVMVLNFSFAFTLWLLFLFESKSLRPEKPSGDKKTIENYKENKTDQKRETEEIRPWILFSIIYYLSMIRESGARHSPQQKTASKKKSKKFLRNMPQTGIIFAYAS